MRENLSREDLGGDCVRSLLRVEHQDLGLALVLYDPAPARALTRSERRLARLVGLNLGNKGIAHKVGLSETTVKGSLQLIYGKTRLGGRAALARYAVVAFDGAAEP